ncbi:3-hydroxyacyl-CoA dehydrogenase family protein [Paeniglutamicibacter psychrophenolicus]|uniref:3-hydroxyacyl-CoA dehydrogenase family protein n=1 Tax=Paeniglutamicibacter psychrophenolicus TaxID=257454 RepID=UPI002780122A|nr:3-hydroxyacyl-CoA dehydrogenase family protein [Paeniglutamicibacter psychrophenolicus]MDQ0093166.1 3-hydroxybutyryl-CoA dehydrogenase [Paeniglutamicibacter psychrophenolicus]
MQINNILVIGSGAMGSQIGMVAALAGYTTTIQDIAEESLAAARDQLSSRMDHSLAKGRLSREDANAAMARLHFTTSLEEGAANADYVIEAATEKLEIKRAIFAALDVAAPTHAILATNSSTLGSSKVASATSRPSKVCNMHFFNPALVMKCVEVVRHGETSQETIDTTMELARSMGKSPVLVNKEIPGFVANRLMGALRDEALALQEAGIASIADIDTTAKTALGHPMGPFELMDLVGLDVSYLIRMATYQETGDESDLPHPDVKALYEAGRFGKKTGSGWYDYDASGAKK